jgi:hypothetical protein
MLLLRGLVFLFGALASSGAEGFGHSRQFAAGLLGWQAAQERIFGRSFLTLAPFGLLLLSLMHWQRGERRRSRSGLASRWRSSTN